MTKYAGIFTQMIADWKTQMIADAILFGINLRQSVMLVTSAQFCDHLR